MQFAPVTKKIDLAEGEVAAYDVCETWVALAEVERFFEAGRPLE